MTTINVASNVEIRAQFPALKRFQDGQPIAYFDGPGGTQVPQSVVEHVICDCVNHSLGYLRSSGPVKISNRLTILEAFEGGELSANFLV